ncbi:hypothetical protein J3Q64DRAFT_1870894 [Phycomyces blakesleeanus]|uniref:Uncharacterized protein n=1 Tax=Phycomyces blakesleeanus TaxID=4837 RepID=A0ABR3APL3_PHYBL
MDLMVASNNIHNRILFCSQNLTSVANNKCKSCEMALLLARPDSTISKVMGTEIGQTVGYEEVKPALQALNRELVGKDLLPISLKEFPLFIPKAEHFALVSSRMDQQPSLMPTLSDNEIAKIMDIHTSRKRKESSLRRSDRKIFI